MLWLMDGGLFFPAFSRSWNRDSVSGILWLRNQSKEINNLFLIRKRSDHGLIPRLPNTGQCLVVAFWLSPLVRWRQTIVGYECVAVEKYYELNAIWTNNRICSRLRFKRSSKFLGIKMPKPDFTTVLKTMHRQARHLSFALSQRFPIVSILLHWLLENETRSYQLFIKLVAIILR